MKNIFWKHTNYFKYKPEHHGYFLLFHGMLMQYFVFADPLVVDIKFNIIPNINLIIKINTMSLRKMFYQSDTAKCRQIRNIQENVI